MPLLLLLFGIAEYINHSSFRENILTHTRRQLQILAESNSIILENKFKSIITDLAIIARNPYLQDLRLVHTGRQNAEINHPEIMFYNKHFDIITSIQRLNSGRRILSVYPFTKGITGNLLPRDELTGSEEPREKDVIILKKVRSRKPHFVITAPLKQPDRNGKITGYLRVMIKTTTLNRWLEHINLRGRGTALIEDNDTTIIAHPDGIYIGKKHDFLYKPGKILAEKKPIMLRDKKIYLGIHFSTEEINRDINKHLIQTIIMILLAFLFVTILGIIIYKKENEETVYRVKLESEMKFSSLMDNTGDMIFLTDSAGRVIFFNRAVQKKFKINDEEARGAALSSFWCDESGRKITDKLTESVKSRSTATVNARCDNSLYNVAISPIIINKRIVWMLCIARDVTRLVEVEDSLIKKNYELNAALEELEATNDEFEAQNEELIISQEKLKQSEERFRNIVEASPMGILIYEVDSENRLIFSGYNRAADKILQVDCSKFMGHTLEEAFPPLSGTEIPGRYLKAALQGEPWNTEEVVYHDDQIHGAYEVHAFQIKPGTMGALFYDTTARKRTEREIIMAREEAEKASESKNIFLATMSHEIRTPMNAIIGMTDLAMITDQNEERLEYLITVKDSARHLMTLITDILDISKIEEDRFPIHFRNFNLMATLEYVIKSLTPEALNKGLQLQLNSENVRRELVVGDRERIIQVLLNLINNAIKFTEKGHVLVSAEYDPHISDKNKRDAGKDNLTVKISDTGPGILESEVDNIFNSFTQIDGTYTRKHGGAGLGLAISKKIAETMGGKIIVESVIGRGSTFTFRIPLIPSNFSRLETTERSEKQKSPASSNGSKKILLAEDNAVNAKLIEILLKRNGHEVSVAKDGIEALEILKNSEFDMILMDIEMPRMDGLETARLIRNGETGNGNKNIPIIAITAHVLEEIEKQCHEAGMNDYISKPVNIKKLVSIVSRSAEGNA